MEDIRIWLRLLFSPFLFMAVCHPLTAQKSPKNGHSGERKDYEAQVASLLALAASCIKNGSENAELSQKALLYMEQAIALSEKHKLPRSLFNARMDKNDLLLSTGQVGELKQTLVAATDSTRAEIARNISLYYFQGKFQGRDYKMAVEYAKVWLDVSKSGNDITRQITAHNHLGSVYFNMPDYDKAEWHFLKVLELGRNRKDRNIGYAYIYLVELSDRRGYYNRAVQYGLEGLRYIARPGYDENSMFIYFLIGRAYGTLGDFENSLFYLHQAIQYAGRGTDMGTFWYYVNALTNTYLQMGHPEQALQFIEESLKKYPPPSMFPPSLMRGKIFTVLKRYDEARTSLLKAKMLDVDSIGTSAIYKGLADLYFATGELNLSKQNVEKIFQLGRQTTAKTIAASHLLAFQIDSALGQFQSASRHLQLYQQINDSINALSKLKQVEELKLQYQTENLVQDARLKQQTILLLEKQQVIQSREFEATRLNFLIQDRDKENHLLTLTNVAAEKDKTLLLKERSIMQLETENRLKLAGLENAVRFRKISFAFLILFLLIILLLYRQFRAKQAASNIIGVKNSELQRLVGEKEGLLNEKDWLLKEVHHRVKNNLQTVVSLLEAQSAFLDSKALEANQDSRNRVYAMSLVHQKLYQTDNLSSIQMDSYLGELVGHLRNSLAVSGIHFSLQLMNVRLDVTQAIPLGLILNEAITNSVKHAFPFTQNQKIIEVNLCELPDSRLCLSILDNGTGFHNEKPAGLSKTIGLKLMEGLTGDISGEFRIYCEHGTVVQVMFVRQDAIEAISQAK